MGVRSVGVEEELLLVDPGTGRPCGMAGAVLRAAGDGSMEEELQREQIETGTRPVAKADELVDELRRWRAAAAHAAEQEDVAVAALATSPLPVEPHIFPEDRYERMAERFGLLAREQLTCGCHVHVEVASPDEGVGVIDRIGPWLPVLRAVTANSPYWQGGDTGYASYRTEVWGRWPSAGPTELFGSAAAYDATVAAMVGTGTVLDTGMIYFDARLNQKLSTVEVRVADVMLDVEDVVVFAALARALVTTGARQWQDGSEPAVARTEVLKLAHWQAAHAGLAQDLVDPRTMRPAAASVVLDALCEHVGDALREAGDDDLVRDGVARLLRRGTGARTQRETAHRHDGDLRAVVEDAVTRTRA
jgi:glutamate---cysteine ligase / carboxylate-amine ligase